LLFEQKLITFAF